MTTAVWTSEIRNNISTTRVTPIGGCNSSTTSGWELNSTEQGTSSAPLHEDDRIPIIGYPGPLFTAIHVAAMTSLSLSTVTVTILFIYLCGCSGSVKEQVRGTTSPNENGAVSKRRADSVDTGAALQREKKNRLSFWNWNVGERFVVYLGVCDLCQGVTHLLDHAYMLYAKDHPPDRICAVFAFFVHNSIFCQWFVVVATAVSACSLIVFGRKMSLGRFDWRLIAFAFGIPTSISVTALSLGLLGAGGAWCIIKYGAPSWRLYTQFVSIFQISSFGFVGVAYGAIWIKIKRTTNLLRGSTTERYQNSAKVMMIFVAVFIFQWWPYTLTNIWDLFAIPPPQVLVLTVTFINLGGVYNSIAYTIIRRRLQRQKCQNTVVISDNITSTTIAANSLGDTRPTTSAPRDVCVAEESRVPDMDDSGVAVSQVTEAWSGPIVPDSDAGEKQDADPYQIHIHL